MEKFVYIIQYPKYCCATGFQRIFQSLIPDARGPRAGLTVPLPQFIGAAPDICKLWKISPLHFQVSSIWLGLDLQQVSAFSAMNGFSVADFMTGRSRSPAGVSNPPGEVVLGRHGREKLAHSFQGQGVSCLSGR